ncbi:MAG: hypothetical protein LUG91_00070 [Ruminococcus sp.]|nr:hypothetical protein [Ruminococcus sp.]
MYRIMIVKSKRDNYASLYQFMTAATEDGESEILEIETKEELDSKIETMLNDEGYAKSDFIVVNVVDYTILATDYSDEAEDEESSDDVSADASDE